MKQWILDAAEVVDSYRVFPRLIVFAYAYMCGHLTLWYEALHAPTSEQTAFAGLIVGLATPLAGLYLNTGRDWNKRCDSQ